MIFPSDAVEPHDITVYATRYNGSSVTARCGWKYNGSLESLFQFQIEMQINDRPMCQEIVFSKAVSCELPYEEGADYKVVIRAVDSCNSSFDNEAIFIPGNVPN